MGPPFYLQIPYISQHVNNKIKGLFKNLNINVRVYHKQRSLKSLIGKRPKYTQTCTLTNCQTKKFNICYSSHIVYKVTCSHCNASYIGYTTRFLHTRIHEHFTIKHTSIYKHFLTCPHTYTISILAHEYDTVKLRILEGIYIQKQRPSINSRNELNNEENIIV